MELKNIDNASLTADLSELGNPARVGDVRVTDNFFALLRLLIVAVSFTISIEAIAQGPLAIAEPPLDSATRNMVIDELLKQLNRVYVLPDVAKKMELAIRARQAKKEYDAITNGPELARALTEHLHQVRNDDHLSVEYFASAIPYDSEKPPDPADVRRFEENGRRRNYEYRKVERLDGGIGLLEVDGFYPEEMAKDTIVAAMSFLANSEAIILDLRQNHGGAGATLLCSYFFEDETHLSDAYNRKENTTRQFWTYPIVPGKKLADKDLYILTSHETISAPEELAFDMQYLKRATLVGETTHGGAHPTTMFRITDHFSAAIPFARTIHPGIDEDDNDSGVKPDVAVPANQALLTAHLLALKKAMERHSNDPDFVAGLRQTLAEKEKELEAIKTPSAAAPDPSAKVFNRRLAKVAHASGDALYLDDSEGDGVAWWPEKVLSNGTIDFEVKGRDVLQKSFVGVAFHGVDEQTYDAVYFRPFDFHSNDEARRAHAVQYISLPGSDWNKLRTDHPGQYEKPIESAPEPNDWFHVRIVLSYPKVIVYVNNAQRPCLEINQLTDRRSGWVGFWVGNGSDGSFANLKLTESGE